MAVTNIQLMEWLAKGNGIAKNEGGSFYVNNNPYVKSGLHRGAKWRNLANFGVFSD